MINKFNLLLPIMLVATATISALVVFTLPVFTSNIKNTPLNNYNVLPLHAYIFKNIVQANNSNGSAAPQVKK